MGELRQARLRVANEGSRAFDPAQRPQWARTKALSRSLGPVRSERRGRRPARAGTTPVRVQDCLSLSILAGEPVGDPEYTMRDAGFR